MWGGAASYLADIHEPYLGIDVGALKQQLTHWLDCLERGEPFSDTELPFSDSEVRAAVVKMANKKGRTFGGPSDLQNIDLIERHRRRDRSEVVEARSQSLARKRGVSVDDQF